MLLNSCIRIIYREVSYSMSHSPGEFLKQLRLEQHLTQNQIAKYLGITRQAYAYYEHSDSIPDIEILMQLSSLYHIPLETFLTNIPSNTNRIAEASSYAASALPDLYPEFIDYYTQQENMKKYHHLTRIEKKVLFLFQKLSPEEQSELLFLAYCKAIPLFQESAFLKD